MVDDLPDIFSNNQTQKLKRHQVMLENLKITIESLIRNVAWTHKTLVP